MLEQWHLVYCSHFVDIPAGANVFRTLISFPIPSSHFVVQVPRSLTFNIFHIYLEGRSLSTGSSTTCRIVMVKGWSEQPASPPIFVNCLFKFGTQILRPQRSRAISIPKANSVLYSIVCCIILYTVLLYSALLYYILIYSNRFYYIMF